MNKLNTYRRMGWHLQANPVAILASSMVLAVITIKLVELLSGNAPTLSSFLIGLGAYSLAAANLVVAPAWGLYYQKAIQRDYGPLTAEAVKELFARHQEASLNIPKIAEGFGELE